MLEIINGDVFLDGMFSKADVSISGDCISHIGAASRAGEVIDASGKYVIPGYVDIHIHGARGKDFCDGTAQAFSSIARYLATVGVTSFLGTSMSYRQEVLQPIFEAAGKYMSEQPADAAVMRGINMEGPFFSKEKRGAHAESNIMNPDIDMFEALYAASRETIALLDLAPELPHARELIARISNDCRISLAHTQANYETAAAAFEAGASHVTHLFNAMPPFHHRDPGVIGAAVDFAQSVELICDGIHLHPAVVRSAFRLFGRERICLISDAMATCGMPNGTYDLDGEDVIVDGNAARLRNGTIAGSCTPLSQCVRWTIEQGIPAQDVIYCATAVPARSIGVDDCVGTIAVGKRADIVLLNADYSVSQVILAGTRIHS